MPERQAASGQREGLSEREKDILRLVARGASNKEIAAELDISANTVKVHLRNVFSKLDVRSRTEASMAAIEMGLVQPAGLAAVAPVPVGASLEEPLVPPGPRRAPVRTWQRLVMLAAVLAAVVAYSWPGARGAGGTIREADALTDATSVSGGGAAHADVGRWREMAQLPSPRARFAVAMVGREIIVAGGDSDSGVTARVEVYSVDTNTWRLAASKPTAVSNATSVVIDGLVYVAGGYLADGALSDVLEVYDPAVDAWEVGPPLPRPMCSYAAAADGGRLYLFGGWDGSAYSGASYALDVASGEWSAVADLPYARGHAAAVALGGRVYVAGGYDGSRALPRVDVFDVAHGSWTTAPPLMEPRAGLALVAVGDSLFAIGGGWTAPVTRAESLEAEAGKWRWIDSPVVGVWRNLGAVADGSTIYAMGGWNEALLSGLFSYQAVYSIMIPLAR